MITRSKLVEQLRDYQIRSQHKVDVAVAIGFALLCCMLVVLSLMTLYLRHFWLFLVFIFFSIFLLARLRLSRQTLARRRERRLPLSI